MSTQDAISELPHKNKIESTLECCSLNTDVAKKFAFFGIIKKNSLRIRLVYCTTLASDIIHSFSVILPKVFVNHYFDWL